MGLKKKIGDFTSKEEVTVEKVIEIKNCLLEKLDCEDFLHNVESGYTAFDDMVVAYYDYLDGGIGSVYVYLSVSKDGSEYFIEYGIASENEGHVTPEGFVSFGEEDRLLAVLKETILASTKEFAASHKK